MKLRLLNPYRWLRSFLAKSLPGFDPVYYLYWYKDVDDAGLDPLRHYLERGWKEGRDPSAGFSTLGYLAANQDVAAAGLNPLLHFVKVGFSEGRVGYIKDPKSIAPQPGKLATPLESLQILPPPSLYALPPLQGSIDEINFDMVNGWAFGAATPNAPAEIEIFVDRCLVGTIIANTYRPDMADNNYSNAHHGFTYRFLPPLNPFLSHVVTVRRAVDKLVIAHVVLEQRRS